MNRILSIAKHDFENARRSYMLWGVVAVYTLIVGLVTVVPGLLSGDVSGSDAVELITAPAGIFVPITAVIASYLAIAGERESGQLKILLSLPPSRQEVLLGKFLGRSGVVLAAVFVAFVVGTIGALPLYDEFPVGPYLLAMGLTALLGLAFVGLSVGISANSTTRTRAMAPAVGVVILFATGVWSGLVTAVNAIFEFGLDTSLDQETLELLRILSPGQAYGRLFNRLVRSELIEPAVAAQPPQLGGIPDTTNAPFYLQDWFVFLLLVAWIVVPVALGYLRFQAADIS